MLRLIKSLLPLMPTISSRSGAPDLDDAFPLSSESAVLPGLILSRIPVNHHTLATKVWVTRSPHGISVKTRS